MSHPPSGPQRAGGEQIQAVILAGGKGERLRPLTDNLPKPLIPIKGRPFLVHQISYLLRFGLNEFILCIGHLSEMIEDHFKKHPIPGAYIQFSIEDEPLGTGGALRNAEQYINEEFLLLNGDALTLLDFADLVRYYNAHDFPVVMTAYDNHDRIEDNNIHVRPDCLVTGYSKKSPHSMNSVDSGILVVKKKDFFEYMPNIKKFAFEHEVYPRLIDLGKILAYPTSARFYDIGTPERLKRIEEIL